MDFVYICGPDVGEELRYSIRSVVKNAPFRKIWVVGSKPSWYSGDYIEVPQDMGKYDNAIRNLKTVCMTKEISPNFVLMNDDFFIIKKTPTIKYFHGGLLLKKAEAYMDLTPSSLYVKKLEATIHQLLKDGIERPLDYDLHIPMKMNKKRLVSCLEDKKLLWRSLYGNRNSVSGKEIKDVKVYAAGRLRGRNYDLNNLTGNYLSSDNNSFELIKDKVLGSMFPEPSLYEKA
jgi:hypothetical protein